MPETFLHGVRIIEVDSGTRPIRTANTSVIGIVGSGTAHADFPLDTPVLVTSISGIKTKLGATSYLTKALEAIYKQAGAVCVVVRTEDPAGSVSDFTGVYALKMAKTQLGLVPKIIVCEGAGETGGPLTDLKSVLASCKAFAYVTPDVTTPGAALTWVTTNGSDRICATWPTVNDGEDQAWYWAGVTSKMDNDQGFYNSPSNKEVFGINTLDSPVDFALDDPTTVANVLNGGKVSTVINQGGFRTWGNRTTSSDSKWDFIMGRRIADALHASLLENQLWAVDRNINKTFFEEVAGNVNDYIARLVNQGALIGGRCWADPDVNTEASIALGNAYFNFEFTHPYPAQTIQFNSILTTDYLSEILTEQ
jgi:phage tail sheath protein FI